MKIKRHHRKTIVTDLYTIQDKNKMYFYINYTNGYGKNISSEARFQNGKLVSDSKLLKKIKETIDLKSNY